MIDAKAIVTHWRRDPIDEWRRDQRRQEMIRRYARTATDPRADNHALAREVEGWIAGELEALGHVVRFTTHKAAYDLLIDGRLRIEVKASRWLPDSDPGRERWRYQANIRTRQKTADVVIFVAVNSRGRWPFIMPAEAVGNRRSITIRTFDPTYYAGRWSKWLLAWDVLGPALESAKLKTRQLELSEVTN
ncbi:MAG: hypothetical protein H6631_20655 [Anaerolineaceae bacterium]|nr:hypothetical protein [Anaerolineaceae bacterium]